MYKVNKSGGRRADITVTNTDTMTTYNLGVTTPTIAKILAKEIDTTTLDEKWDLTVSKETATELVMTMLKGTKKPERAKTIKSEQQSDAKQPPVATGCKAYNFLFGYSDTLK